MLSSAVLRAHCESLEKTIKVLQTEFEATLALLRAAERREALHESQNSSTIDLKNLPTRQAVIYLIREWRDGEVSAVAEGFTATDVVRELVRRGHRKDEQKLRPIVGNTLRDLLSADVLTRRNTSDTRKAQYMYWFTDAVNIAVEEEDQDLEQGVVFRLRHYPDFRKLIQKRPRSDSAKPDDSSR